MKYFMDFNIKVQQTRLHVGLPWRSVTHQKIVVIRRGDILCKILVASKIYCLLTQAEGLSLHDTRKSRFKPGK